MLTGFAMRSDPNVAFERGIRVIRSLPPKRKSTATHRAHASIHLASRRSGSARLLRSTRGPVLLAQRGRCGTHRRLGSLLNANSVEQEVRCVCKGGAAR